MIQLFKNILAIGSKLPAIIAVIRAIADVVGSDQVQALLEAFRDALKKEVPNPDIIPDTEPARLRLVDRIRQRRALDDLGLSKADYEAACRIKGVSGSIDDNLQT